VRFLTDPQDNNTVLISAMVPQVKQELTIQEITCIIHYSKAGFIQQHVSLAYICTIGSTAGFIELLVTIAMSNTIS
jgi:hypothetical protein